MKYILPSSRYFFSIGFIFTFRGWWSTKMWKLTASLVDTTRIPFVNGMKVSSRIVPLESSIQKLSLPCTKCSFPLATPRPSAEMCSGGFLMRQIHEILASRWLLSDVQALNRATARWVQAVHFYSRSCLGICCKWTSLRKFCCTCTIPLSWNLLEALICSSKYFDHFRTFDKDCSGFIDFREFLMAIDVTSCGSPEERLQWAFRWADLVYDATYTLLQSKNSLSNRLDQLYVDPFLLPLSCILLVVKMVWLMTSFLEVDASSTSRKIAFIHFQFDHKTNSLFSDFESAFTILKLTTCLSFISFLHHPPKPVQDPQVFF